MPYQAGARYGLTSAQTITTTPTTVNFNSTNATYGGYQRTGISNSSGVITVTNAGIYDINMVVRTEGQPFASATQFLMNVDNGGNGNGTFVTWQRLYLNSNTQAAYEHAPPLHAKLQLVAGARIKIVAQHGGTNFDLSPISNTVCFLTINKIA